MSVPSGRLPAQISELARRGIDLDVRSVNCSGGILTNIDDYLRPNNKAKRIRNFHQFTRGVFSSGGGGWRRDNASGLNGGLIGLDFGLYVDALGAQFLVVQIAGKLYNYNISTHAGATIAGMTTLDATALPCIRPAAPTQATANPFSIYCNGKIEPKKIYNAAAGSAPDTAATLGFNNGYYTETVTITGAVAAGDVLSLTFTSVALTLSPTTLSYTCVTGDTTTTIAQALATQINTSTSVATAGVICTSSNNVITISYPISITDAAFSSAVSPGSETITLAAGTTTPTFPGVFNGLTYTKPALCSPFLGRVAYAKFANDGASGNAVAGQLLISSLGNAESFKQSVPVNATDAWTIPIPPILGAVTALFPFRPLTNVASEILVIGCANGMAIVTGTDATSFRLEIQTQQFGVPSNRTFVQLDNTLLFMATDGFRTYNGTNNVSNLITDGITLDFYDEWLKIDKAGWQVSHAVHHRDTQEIWFWVPHNGPDGVPAHGDNGQPQHAFVYNYNSIDGSPIWYFVDNTICMASIEFNNTFYGVDDIGLIQKWYKCNNYDDAVAGYGGEANVTPGAEIVLPLIGMGNPAQSCSINHVVVGASNNDQKFLINAATYELMSNGATRKQQMQPINFLLQSVTAGQTVLGVASPVQWILGQSAFPSLFPKFLSDYVPVGHGRLWEFSMNCNDTSHNLDFTFLQATISLGGQRI